MTGLPSYCAEASESCPTRQDFFILLSWHISLRKCPQSVKHSCTDQGHLLRDGQTRNDRLHQSRMISVGVHALHLNPVHSSFVCPAMPLTSFFASAFRVSKNLRPPESGTAGLVLLLSRWHDSGTDERREDRDLSPWHPQG